MEEASSPTDVSSSLSEFVRRERIYKELYQDTNERRLTRDFKPLRYNDEEIDDILQQMGRLLSPAGHESDNQIYKHVIEETENKSIEQILTEAKELINDNIIPNDGASISLSTDNLSSVSSANDITFINVEDVSDADKINGNYDVNDFETALFSQETPKLNNRIIKDGIVKGQGHISAQFKTEVPNKRKINNVQIKKSLNNKNEEFRKEMQILRDEIKRVNQLYESCKVESVSLRKEMARLEKNANAPKRTREENTLITVKTINREFLTS